MYEQISPVFAHTQAANLAIMFPVEGVREP